MAIVSSLAFMAACGRGEQATMYALIPPSKNGDHFNQDLARLVKRQGLKPDLDHATDDRGRTLFVLQATGRSVRLWSQNVVLSGHEAPELCGKFDEAHPDPGQYIIYVQPTFPMWNSRDAEEIASQLRIELNEIGYTIRSAEVTCSSLSKPSGSPAIARSFPESR